MAEPIGPGTMLERWRPVTYGPTLAIGSVWTVETVEDGFWCGACDLTVGVTLVELADKHNWCPCGFKPYRPGETAAKLFAHHLKRPAPVAPAKPEPVEA